MDRNQLRVACAYVRWLEQLEPPDAGSRVEADLL